MVDNSRAKIQCAFRRELRTEDLDPVLDSSSSASCELIERISGLNQPVPVSDRACVACGGGGLSEALRGNPVLPSLLFGACHDRLVQINGASEPADPGEVRGLKRWMDWAERDLVSDSMDTTLGTRSWTCDVWVPLWESCSIESLHDRNLASVRSILSQSSAHTQVHLIGNRYAARLAESMNDSRRVRWFAKREDETWGSALQRLVATPENVRSQYLAWHDPRFIADPDRIRMALEALWMKGAEFVFAGVNYRGTDVVPGVTPPRPKAHSWGEVTRESIESDADPLATVEPVTRSTLVCRRASLIDLGGFDDGDDVLGSLTRRVIEHQRPIEMDSRAMLRIDPDHPDDTSSLQFAVRETAPLPVPIGFSMESAACDVVLPFFNHLDYVGEALESLVNQEGADVTIHVVDDASTEDTADLRRRWNGNPHIRFYRNQTNIGQFMSFNNVSEFCETGLMAVQDADDVSLPNRICVAANHLRLSDAEFFGGAVTVFGDSQAIRPVLHETNQLETMESYHRRRSFYPPAVGVPYFIENPTAVFRKDMFERIGGYSDFGTRELNRTSLDTEFLLRCYFSGVRFAITEQIVTRYRVHAQSATQNRVTGWGTSVRSRAAEIVQEHAQHFRGGHFDPRVFGSLRRFRDQTIRQ